MSTATEFIAQIRSAFPRRSWWGLAGALVVGAILRVTGLNWGYPLQLHVDEPVIFGEAVDMSARRSFEPTVFYRPDHVQIKIIYVVYLVWSWVFLGKPVEVAYSEDTVAFRLVARSITVVFGLVLIVLGFLLANTVKRGAGIPAAFLFAVHPTFVEHSRYVTPDVPLAVFVMAGALTLMGYLRHPTLGWLLACSAFTALAIATKYPGALVTVMTAIVVVVAAVRDREAWRILRHGVMALISVIGFTFAVSPVLFANFGRVYAALVDESRLDDTTTTMAERLGWYGSTFFVLSGVVLSAAMVLGLWWVIRHRKIEAIVLALSAIFWLGLAFPTLYWERWMTPMLWAPLVLGAIGLHTATQWATQAHRTPQRWGVTAAWVLVFGHLLGQTLVERTIPFIFTETRLAGVEILERKGITLENTASEGFSPLRPDSSRSIVNRFTLRGDALLPEDEEKEYALISSILYGDVFERDPISKADVFYRTLDDNYPLVVSIDPDPLPFVRTPWEPVTLWTTVGSLAELHPDLLVGPSLRVYDLRPAG